LPQEPEGAPRRAGDQREPPLRVVGPDAAAERYASWDELYADNVVRVYRLLFAKVGNRADAEDLAAEVFLSAYGPLRLDASKPEVRAYLARTAQTTLASFWRARLGREVTTIELDAAEGFFADPPSPSQAATRARSLLAALPERYRRVLELRFLDRRSVRDVAREMDVSVANAKVLQHRALRMAADIGEAQP
jgi:RNA polymerase sigma-70 factor (ECF subfamily)